LQPIGVSTHRIGKDVPEQLKTILPAVEQLELDTAAAELEAQKDSGLNT